MKTYVKRKSTLVSGHPQEPRGRPPPLHDPERHRGNHPTGQCSSSHLLLSTAGLLVFVGLLFVPAGQHSSPHLLLSTAGLFVFVGPLCFLSTKFYNMTVVRFSQSLLCVS